MYESDLLPDAGDEFGAVASTDDECLSARAEEPALNPQPRSALVALGVDDEHAGRADCDVVEVRATARDASVMEHEHAAVA